MARYTGSVTKRSRKFGVGLDGYPKCEVLKRPFPAGQHGQMRRKVSDYGLHLLEKQKIRFTYGLSEKQFRRYYEVVSGKKGVTGVLLLQRLESRLDNILYRSGLAASRPQARQLIAHGHLLVNGEKVDIASYLLKPGDTIVVKPRSQTFFKNLQELRKQPATVPHWLATDLDKLQVTYTMAPQREDIDQTLKEHLVIEYYSR